MSAAPTPHVTIAEHTVYDAICVMCPWTSEGHVQREWAEHVAVQHEQGHSVAVETKNENEEGP